MYIIIAIILFGLLIIVHEAGHLAAAKLCGVKVNEFAVGMGPKIISRRRGETLYSWRVFPIGGFCAMEGEDRETDEPRAFTNQAAWKRVIILLAGSAMNFLFGVLLIALLAPSLFPKGFQTAEITGFLDGCPYVGENAFLEGDIFYKIDGERIYGADDASLFLNWQDSDSTDTHDIVILRDGEKITYKNMTLIRTVTDSAGNANALYGFSFGRFEDGFGGMVKSVWYECIGFVRMVRISLVQLFTGAAGLRDMSGPVGIVSIINENASQASSQSSALRWIGWFGAFIAVNLAVMNLLPIPALDGGRIFFLLITKIIETLTKRKINPKYEGYIHGATYVLLLGLMAVVMVNDIIRIIK